MFLRTVNIKKHKSSLRRKKPCFGAMESNSTRVEFDSIFVESNSIGIEWLFT